QKHTNVFIHYLLIVELLHSHFKHTGFNSFHVIWKDIDNTTHKEPLNPYSITFKQGIQHVQYNLQMLHHFADGRDELIFFKYISLNQKTKFNPLLYECDLHKLKIIGDTIRVKLTRNNQLQKLLHEVIKNNYLCDLLNEKNASNPNIHASFKQQINYNENGELILNDEILTILNELKILYHDDIHKQMGYPLQLEYICAILLYCGKSYNVQFNIIIGLIWIVICGRLFIFYIITKEEKK
ncbi:hypothetical protein RFI_35365, partial [Reticulomyxa filosa]